MRKRILGFIALCALVSGLCVRSAYGQFDMGVIISLLTTMNQTMKTVLGAPLAAINTIKQQEQSFQQTVLYPQSQISSFQSFASQSNSQMSSAMTTMSSRTVNSQLPNTSAFESVVLSGNASNVNQLRPAYTSVYGTLPASSTTPQNVLNVIDAQDAAAQDAYSRAIQLDALSTQEAQQAKNYMTQLQSATPGTVPMIDAQLCALLVQANAYTQMGQAEMLRSQASLLGVSSYGVKTTAALATKGSVQ